MDEFQLADKWLINYTTEYTRRLSVDKYNNDVIQLNKMSASRFSFSVGNRAEDPFKYWQYLTCKNTVTSLLRRYWRKIWMPGREESS